MSLTTTSAILLRSYPYSESSQVLRFYAEELGAVSAIARGARKSVGRRGAPLSTFSQGALTLNVRANRELQTLKGFEPSVFRRGLSLNPLRLSAASVLGEIVLRHGEPDPHPALYLALVRGMDAIEGCGLDHLVPELLIQLWSLVRELGYTPLLDECVHCGRPIPDKEMSRFDFAAGGLRCPACLEGEEAPVSVPKPGRSSGAFCAEELRASFSGREPTSASSAISSRITFPEGPLSGPWMCCPPCWEEAVRRLILGTAGHIDHGKTALVKALTGVDTDRLKEEKERGITVDLGFAEFKPDRRVRFGVVDVPGHEGFIRNMLAGATGVDVVLLVVAADEGVMPQTREHLAIVRLLGVPRLAVALTKTDLVDPEWVELVSEEVRDLLLDTPYQDAPLVAVSSTTGDGLERLAQVLADVAEGAEERSASDVSRLPIDRVFSVRGAGTVVTGTLWSGILRAGDRCRVLPGAKEARVRSLQIHGEEVREAQAGGRVAVGLSGAGVSHQAIHRGQALVQGEGWETSWMLTAFISVLEGTGWNLEQGQRVRVHLGTAEVLARVTLLDDPILLGGEAGWVQMRLEEPVLARVRDHLVVRSYSPITTIGGGRVAEVLPRKKRRLREGENLRLEARLGTAVDAGLLALLGQVAWDGVHVAQLPQRTGFGPAALERAQAKVLQEGKAARIEDHLFGRKIWDDGRQRLLFAMDRYHGAHPLRTGMPLEELRQVLPGGMGQRLADTLIKDMATHGSLHIAGGIVALADFQPRLTKEQRRLRDRLHGILARAGLTPPTVRELANEVGGRPDLEDILRVMEADGELIALDPDLFVSRSAVVDAGRKVVDGLAGASDLGPADFRTVLPLTRKHLLPLLRYFDRVGITIRRDDARSVAEELPEAWGNTLPTGEVPTK